MKVQILSAEGGGSLSPGRWGRLADGLNGSGGWDSRLDWVAEKERLGKRLGLRRFGNGGRGLRAVVKLRVTDMIGNAKLSA